MLLTTIIEKDPVTSNMRPSTLCSVKPPPCRCAALSCSSTVKLQIMAIHTKDKRKMHSAQSTLHVQLLHTQTRSP